jgi:multiple sugar transport system substrate-binding protein
MGSTPSAARMNRREAIATLSGAALAVAGCGRSSQKELTFWGAGREGDIAAELIRGFEQEHPELRVNVQKMPFTVAHEKLLTAYAGETLPDLCQLGNTWIPEFAALDALEPLDGYVSGSKHVPLEDYFDGILASNRLDDTLFGIPWYVDTRLLYYRRDLLSQAGFQQPPQTWQEWSEQLGAIKAMVGPDRYSVLLPVNEFEPLLVLALQLPAELLRDGGRFGNFRGQDFRRSLTFYESMFRQDWAPRMTNTQISNVWDEFGRGFFSFYISGPWNIAEFKKRLPPAVQNEWMTATMPGPDGPGLSSAGGSSLVIFKSSQAKAEAWLLAEYLSRPAVQQQFYNLTGDMPPRRSSWQMPALVESPYARAYLAQLDRVRSPPKVPEWERIATEMRLASERVVQRVQSVDAAVVALDRKTDEILAKRRWMLEQNTLPGASS